MPASAKATDPNLFLIGAPKAGTTAMCEYLRTHSNVYFSEPKEPCFWASDLPGLRQQLGMGSMDSYVSLFEPAASQRDVRAVGEGSTVYLMSDVAIKRILEFNPDAKFIAMLRHPVQLAYSFHGQMLKTMNEDCHSFERAWNLQADRQSGRSLPRRCVEPRLLQYREVANVASQLQTAKALIPDDQLLVILHDDFCANPTRVYGDVLNFIGLPPDDRQAFEKHNVAARYRSSRLANCMQHGSVRRFAHASKRLLSPSLVRSIQTIKNRLLFEPVRRERLSTELHAALCDEFRDEIRLLESLLERTLPDWFAVPQT